MKIAVRGGHNFLAKGASGLIDETTEDRKVKDAVIKYLKQAGHSVLDVTPGNMDSSSDLAYGVNKANNWRAELFISIHFNNAYDSYNGAIGSEVCVYNTFDIAQRVVNKLGALGFKNRGQKVRQGLYELRKTACKAIICEVCFCEATEDVTLYKKLGADVIGKAIAEGLTGQTVNSTPSTPKPQAKVKKTWEINIQGQIIKDLQYQLNVQCNANLKVDGYCGDNTVNKLITVRKGARGNITKIIQKLLIRKGYSVGSYGADSVFGNGTYNAVCAIQKANGLSVDGVVGKNTWKVLLKK
ncbi:N-acetylmuramoyl-L-alanine amidase [Clostridium sp. KNHs214]|uniref:N-acetylmuramoyl-L-alanine amidase n=1 Tax=Clostridium sp. KNHs214 TaxID=1540257 RepID=UPI00068A043B|nr:N-acetylmuramoyl-L-alanine amidase [Clostridium sp. KNHs214]